MATNFFITLIAVQAVLLATTFSCVARAVDNNNLVKTNTMSDGSDPPAIKFVDVMEFLTAGCRPVDISITQKQVGFSRVPRFQVAITNTCIDHNCVIQNIVASCGQFTTTAPLDPNVFRRDGGGPNCIVNNRLPMTSGQSLSFTYDSEFMAPISLASADPVCH